MTLEDRHIPLQGARNFRDFGGYPTAAGRHVKRGVLFRSDSLHQLTEEDFRRISALGIASICDLRRDRERLHAPTNWDDPTTAIYHLPLISNDVERTLKRASIQGGQFNEEEARRMMKEVYAYLISDDHALHHLRQLFALVAEPANLPVLIHCSGGKDRTGVSCSLILWLLGVSREDIVGDYLRSQELYGDTVDIGIAASQVFDHQDVGEWQYAALKLIFGVQKEYLERVFAILDERGMTPERFLTEMIGADPDLLERLRAALLAD
jgi:protein-tyrosine phosphatase